MGEPQKKQAWRLTLLIAAVLLVVGLVGYGSDLGAVALAFGVVFALIGVVDLVPRLLRRARVRGDQAGR